jgi:large subunit ribosomal protein L4
MPEKKAPKKEQKTTKAVATAKQQAKAPAKPQAQAKAERAPAKPAPAPKAEKAAAKPSAAKASARRAVARPATRVVRREEEPRPRPAPKREAPKPKAAPQPLPTAPAGHAPLIAADGSASGSVELPAAIAQAAPRRGVLFQALIAALANARQATSATKSRSRVAGGGAKPWRQKGTGRARQGTTRAPHWRHGGVVFGPNGRKYEQRMPEKMRRAAFAQALADRASSGRVLVVEELRFDGDQPKTRDVVAWLGKLGDTGRAVLVTAGDDGGVGRAVANLRDLDLRTATTLRLADVLHADTLLVHRAALDALVARATVGAGAAPSDGANSSEGAQ